MTDAEAQIVTDLVWALEEMVEKYSDHSDPKCVSHSDDYCNCGYLSVLDAAKAALYEAKSIAKKRGK